MAEKVELVKLKDVKRWIGENATDDDYAKEEIENFLMSVEIFEAVIE